MARPRAVTTREPDLSTLGPEPPAPVVRALLDSGEMGALVCAHDWSATPLGPLGEWPAHLRSAALICLASRHPMVLWWGPDLVLLYNDAWIPVLGPQKHPALGRPGRAVWPEMWHIIGEQLQSVLDTGRATWSDDQLLPADRHGYLEEAYFTYSYSPVHDDDGAVAGVFTAVIETTQRVLSARRLATLSALGDVSAVSATSVEQACHRALETLARNRLDVPFAALYLADGTAPSARLVAASGVAEGGGELPGTVGPDTSSTVWPVVATGTARTVTGLAERWPGTLLAAEHPMGPAVPDAALVLPVEVAGRPGPVGAVALGISPYRALDEDYRRFLEFVARQLSTAVSDALAHEAERRRARALAELDRAKTEFFANVSHEFRTPLTLIGGPLEELRADPGSTAALDTLARNVLRLHKLVDSVLEFSRLQAGRIEARYVPVDLARLTGELSASFRSAMEAGGLRFDVACPGLGRPVHVDPDMWEKVVLNLLSNALKFTLSGGVRVALRAEGDEAVLEVSDTGSGIPPEHVGKVFDRFHRAPAARARSHEGTGIGLALVRELVELHGGTVAARSAQGQGTTVTVRVPFGSAHLPAAHVHPEPAADPVPARADQYLAEALRWLPEAGDGPPASAAAEKARVLVADDNADLRAYLARLLGAHWHIRTVADGDAALAAALAEPPDLVVSDVMMPGLDGRALVAALRANPRTARVPVLLLSARAGPEAAADGLAAGADDYLAKPFSGAELLARVRGHLELGRLRRTAEQRFDAAVAHSPVLFWTMDPTGHATLHGPGWERLLGAPAGPSRLRERMPPEDLARYDARTGEARAAGEPWEVEFRLRDASGRHRHVLEHAVALPAAGGGGYVGSCVDVTRSARRSERGRVAAEQALHAERERYRTLVAQAPVGIFLADPDGTIVFVNDRGVELFDRPADDLPTRRAFERVHPDDRERVTAGYLDAVAAGREWAGEYRIALQGQDRTLSTTMRPLRDEHGTVTGFLGVTTDTTQQRAAEDERRAHAAEQAARRVSDAAAARLRAMVDGLAAILWEADARTLEFTFVSERAEEILGYPTDRWLGDPGFWPGIIHPDDRAEAVAFCAERTAAGEDHDFSYRACTADGRVRWLHDVVHVVCDESGAPVLMQGVMVDVTEQKRAERSAALLAETGRLLAGAVAPDRVLEALARLLETEFGDAAVISVQGPDGLFRRVAAAHPDPEFVRHLLELAPTRLPQALLERLRTGRAVVIPVSPDLNRAAAADAQDARRRDDLRVHSVLTVPLVSGGEIMGLLGFLRFAGSDGHDPADVELAEEIGRRAALAVRAERDRVRERQLRQVAGDLASAGTSAEAGARLVDRLRAVLGASAGSVYLIDDDGALRPAHAVGYPAEVMAEFAAIPPDADVPYAECVRTGRPVWLHDVGEWRRRYPALADAAGRTGNQAAACLPLRTATGEIVGGVGLSFPTPRGFGPSERTFVAALVAQAAPAFARAMAADRRREVSDALQRSLLPRSLPAVAGLGLAAHYLPGTAGVAAGGDWYDVLRLDGGRVAVVVGDVVGQGAAAAAVMGQLRSSLASYLLEGHPPEVALDRLDAFARTVEGAVGSTATCLVLDAGRRELHWARAGHPPPLVIDSAGARFLDDAVGTVLGVRGRPPTRGGRARLTAGTSVVLYTDGLVERRTESIDAGLARLADAAAGRHVLRPAALTEALLGENLPGGGPADDVALVVARVLPPALVRSRPARPELLRELRGAVAGWAAAAGMAGDAADDLQLALGEAVANAVEHAYAGRPVGEGTVEVGLVAEPDGTVRVTVRDAGRWRPPPPDAGFRGRGLALIRTVGTGVVVAGDERGTEVRFAIPPEAPAPARDAAPPGGADAGPPAAAAAGVTVTEGPDGPRIVLRGDLDLAGAHQVRAEVLAAAGPRPVVVDLTAVGHLASAGLTLLADAAERAAARGGGLRVRVRPGGQPVRALELAGLAGPLGVRADPG